MPTRLSSRWTPFYKFVLPVLCVGGMGVGAWRAYVHPEELKMPPGTSPELGWLMMLALMLLVFVVIWWTVRSLVRLELADDELVISNYFTEIRVPLTSVADISGPSITNPKRYTLTFDESIEFGRTVSFLAPMQWTLLPFSEPEEVSALRRAWETARDGGRRR